MEAVKGTNFSQLVTPSYSYMFKFEEKFSHVKTRELMLNYWTSGFYLCAIYMILIFSIQNYMKDRPKFNLRKFLVVWNTCLAVFSILGASRTLPELLHVLKNFGIYHSVCVQRWAKIIFCYVILLPRTIGNTDNDTDKNMLHLISLVRVWLIVKLKPD